MYSIIGNPPTPDFFDLSADTGVITIKKDLMTDYAPYYVVGTARIIYTSIFMYL